MAHFFVAIIRLFGSLLYYHLQIHFDTHSSSRLPNILHSSTPDSDFVCCKENGDTYSQNYITHRFSKVLEELFITKIRYSWPSPYLCNHSVSKQLSPQGNLLIPRSFKYRHNRQYLLPCNQAIGAKTHQYNCRCHF